MASSAELRECLKMRRPTNSAGPTAPRREGTGRGQRSESRQSPGRAARWFVGGGEGRPSSSREQSRSCRAPAGQHRPSGPPRPHGVINGAVDGLDVVGARVEVGLVSIAGRDRPDVLGAVEPDLAVGSVGRRHAPWQNYTHVVAPRLDRLHGPDAASLSDAESSSQQLPHPPSPPEPSV